MTLDSNFILPSKATAVQETARRNIIIEWLAGILDESTTAILVTGSMAYGYDYSVTEKSDIDIQLLVTQDSILNLKGLNLFNNTQLDRAVKGYLNGLFQQFSLVFQRNSVSVECHFWDEEAFIQAMDYSTSETLRLRSRIDTPSIDYGFSFLRQESVKEYYGEMMSDYPVGVFPSYREENGILYLCRPITNILGLPRVEKTNPSLSRAIQATWERTVEELQSLNADGYVDLELYNIENTLPGKNKMRQDVLATIRDKTITQLAIR